MRRNPSFRLNFIRPYIGRDAPVFKGQTREASAD